MPAPAARSSLPAHPEGASILYESNRVNRGVAVSGIASSSVTLDAALVRWTCALARPFWEVRFGRYHAGHSITSAPLVVKGQI